MTMRGYLIRRQLVASVVCTLCCVGAALILFAMADPATHRYSAYAITAIALAVMPLQWLVRAYVVRCPACRASLGARGIGPRRRCPRCGTNFEAEYRP
jgi:tRNA(Ile2) C34 agmatinyltransferase TiaS